MQQTHPISAGKGELISSTTDDYREKSQSVKELEVDVLSRFTDSEAANKFFEKLYHQKRRYYRDQLQIVKKLFNKYDDRLINNSLSYCLERDLYSAVELKSTRSLGMIHTRDSLDEVIHTAETEQHSYLDFLTYVFDGEILYRQNKARDKQIKEAGFPYLEYLKVFDLTFCKAISPKQFKQLTELT